MNKIQSGTFKGNAIRTARKPGRCHYWLGIDGRCTHEIASGELYVEGEMAEGGNPHARQRWCAAHFSYEELNLQLP